MACLCHGVAVGRAAADEMIVEEMTLTGRASVPLDHAAVTITQREGERVAVPIAMSKSTYRASVRSVIDGVTKDWSGELWCFEVSSTDQAVPFVWALCTSWPIEHVSVLTDRVTRKSYLWLTSRFEGFFIEIARPRGQPEAMADFFLLRDWKGGVHLPIRDVTDALWSLSIVMNAVRGPDVEATSITRDQIGWVLGMRDGDSGTDFTLVSGDGKKWHLQPPDG